MLSFTLVLTSYQVQRHGHGIFDQQRLRSASPQSDYSLLFLHKQCHDPETSIQNRKGWWACAKLMWRKFCKCMLLYFGLFSILRISYTKLVSVCFSCYDTRHRICFKSVCLQFHETLNFVSMLYANIDMKLNLFQCSMPAVIWNTQFDLLLYACNGQKCVGISYLMLAATVSHRMRQKYGYLMLAANVSHGMCQK